MRHLGGRSLRVLFVLVLAGLVAPASGAAARVPVALRCNPVAARTATPIGTSACPGVRPGAMLWTSVGGCSWNFMFKGSDGYRYMGTAGHCLLKSNGTKRWSLGKGPVVRDNDDLRVGRGVFAILHDSYDFSLVRLDRSVKASPQMCHFGGPTGVDTAHMGGPVVLEHYGNGLGISNVTPARTAVSLNTLDKKMVTAVGAINFGDSGSGITRAGKAIGVIVAVGYQIGGSAHFGNMFITRIDSQLPLAAKALGIRLSLVTAPRK